MELELERRGGIRIRKRKHMLLIFKQFCFALKFELK